MKFRQALLEYYLKHGATAAARKYKTTREYVYYWRKRYDGTIYSLRELSRRPHSHPNQHTAEEIRLIIETRRQHPADGLVVFWVELRRKGYTRTVGGLFKQLRRLGKPATKPPNPKYIPKPYQQMTRPGERVQIDVKYVPKVCLAADLRDRGDRFYQFTAIDEMTRIRYLEGFDEVSTFTASIFLKNAAAWFERRRVRIECAQTDNGPEFTNRFTARRGKPTLFSQTADELEIFHKLIRPYAPRHNGKVERSHRKDNEYFYARRVFSSLEDFRARLAEWNREYNHFPMRPLKWKSPFAFLENYLAGHGKMP